MTAETADLRPGYAISRVIKGGWQLAGDHGPVDSSAAIADMEAFLDAGITSFDCADIYTGVEEMIGSFISDVRERRGAEVADRVQVHTKLVPDLARLSELTADEVEAIVDRSLQRLQIDRLHLVQFYWWDTFDWRACHGDGDAEALSGKGQDRPSWGHQLGRQGNGALSGCRDRSGLDTGAVLRSGPPRCQGPGAMGSGS
jgi:aryl-alcohol dehydrogenase-like predicted oxidoreductase